jgi:hypothetical protein
VLIYVATRIFHVGELVAIARFDRFEFGLTVKLTSPEEKEKERAAADKNNAPNAADKTPASDAPASTAKPATAAASESKP